MDAELWAFNCPIHGRRTETFCFRAFDVENIDRWHRIKVERIPFTIQERDAFYKWFKEQAAACPGKPAL